MKRIKKGDTVIVIAGKSKKHIGEVVGVKDDTVVVQGANFVKRHQKKTSAESTGGIISREAPIHVSNVAHYNPVTQKADKVGFKYLEDNGVTKKVRYYKSNNEVIDRI